ncbi:L,D-transpeptidase family protein [Snodgrassella gandavensis]|uniref:L,D-transpeptidase family protein n=1 Tax=Snodgrassella gandavensis TaxID=2946698 RepID=UPI001EF6BF0B|nr:murein L,D-transpeptidase family protein [Snodgrassella gandavensis]
MLAAFIGLLAPNLFRNKNTGIKSRYKKVFICNIICCLLTLIVGIFFVWKNQSAYIDTIPAINNISNSFHNTHPVMNQAQATSINFPAPGDKIYLRLFKQEGILEIWYKHKNQQYQLSKIWKICTFSGGLGPKKAEGDGKSPEGFYATRKSLLNPNSNYHLAFNIGYPNAYDRSKGYTGSYIMIHGKCVSIGCYAMTDKGIEEIYALVNQALNSGQTEVPIHIFPFKMNTANMKKYQGSTHYAFWQELKPAYDIFQSQRRIPDISVHNQHYIVR